MDKNSLGRAWNSYSRGGAPRREVGKNLTNPASLRGYPHLDIDFHLGRWNSTLWHGAPPQAVLYNKIIFTLLSSVTVAVIMSHKPNQIKIMFPKMCKCVLVGSNISENGEGILSHTFSIEKYIVFLSCSPAFQRHEFPWKLSKLSTFVLPSQQIQIYQGLHPRAKVLKGSVQGWTENGQFVQFSEIIFNTYITQCSELWFLAPKLDDLI